MPASRKAKVIMVFLKEPVPGKVKTRLGAAIGMVEASDLYRRLSEQTLKAVRRVSGKGTRVVLWCDPPRRRRFFRRWLGERYDFRCQKGKTLGERMSRAFQEAFTRGGQKVVIVGTDCPGLVPELYKRAFKSLDRFPMVIGPSRDGGYYLLGLRLPSPTLFRGISWSTKSVFRQTMKKAKRAGLKSARLPVLSDVDTREDLKRLGISVSGLVGNR